MDLLAFPVLAMWLAGAITTVLRRDGRVLPALLPATPVRAADPRGQRDLPEKPREVRNPLSYLSAWSAAPDVPLMTVSGPRTTLRWVALADFTGPVWLPDSSYRPAGPDLPPPEVVPPRTTRTTVKVSAGDLPGDWLPVPGIATRVDGVAVGHDAVSGTLLSLDGAVAGHSYTAAGMVPDWSGWKGTRAAAASGTGYERYLRLPPGAPARLRDIAQAAAGNGTAHQRASRIAEYLRDSYTFEPGAPGGHGYAELAELLVPPGRKGGGATSEQFASAFAVLARAAGLPSRVVVGFGAGGGGSRVIRTGDAVAWGEIYFEGLGWVPYDPNPRKRSEASARPGSQERAGHDGTYRGGETSDATDTGARGAVPRLSGGEYTLLIDTQLGLLVLLLLLMPLLRLRGVRRSRRGTARASSRPGQNS
ncbi:DUF3488 and transglutaminase-like domain-containing protein [Actinomadura montaniterrae]|uniref:Transglutaminase domain-containing protein n=1 Tax=Actinomadura montaniterrae TaxID=1803903 RepID=A0A6L3W1S9_9ACTN|nr:transglutaminase domain-containing protein [Actinomadura montaniterrae]KAB2388863.1 transglutaminase domain-containing protein [Actinomadura montaniterrae]